MITERVFIDWIKGLDEQQDIELDYYGEYQYDRIFSTTLSTIQFKLFDEIFYEGASDKISWYLFERAHNVDTPFNEKQASQMYNGFIEEMNK